MNIVKGTLNLMKKKFQKFQRNQPLYLHRLNINFGVGFRDHEESDRDNSFSFAVKVR